MTETASREELKAPPFFDPQGLESVWRVPYQERAGQAREWAERHGIPPASEDDFRIVLVAVDVQNTFCLPDFELFVGGRSGTGAVDDNKRLASFVYRNLNRITKISATMDTHQAVQIFHAIFLVDQQGNHPDSLTLVTLEDVEQGRWRFNPKIAPSIGITAQYGQEQLEHYTRELQKMEKYDLTIWPYHSMLGGIGHALVSGIEEAFFFHTIARYAQVDFIVKGDNALTEAYSAIGPEVTEGPQGERIGSKRSDLMDALLAHDAMIVAGQAKSHCVAWTMEDLLVSIQEEDESLAGKVYLLEDCTSPVVVPGVVDYSEQADAAFEKFERAGMHRVRSTDSISSWPGMQ